MCQEWDYLYSGTEQIEEESEIMMDDFLSLVDVPCSASVGKNMLRFIYTGELDPKVLENDVEVFPNLGTRMEWRR